MNIKKHLKTNWDVYVAYLITIIGLITFKIVIQDCHDLGCLGLIIMPFIAYSISLIFIIIAIIRQIRNKKLINLRWIFITIFLVPLIWIII